ncbi:MAG: hypothetical protein KatS3mg102_1810 [Planctomycetota bacterium]|nr:MAG: hypothetical protein KatS3mg102_1810 [Planctomycetota bacterium]
MRWTRNRLLEQRLALMRQDALQLEVQELRLSNGLTVLMLPDRAAPLFTLMLWVPAGTRTERPGSTGISHALEHCYSLGSRRFGPREIDRMVQALGGRKNAFTSLDFTAYYASLPPQALERIIEAEADRLAHLSLPPERVRRELEVIQEERRLRVDNAPAGRLRERLLALAYQRHPYGLPLIGTAEDLQRLDRDAIAAYYRTHYVPVNVAFALVGDFEPEEAHALFEIHMGAIPAGAVPAGEPPEEPEQHEERREVIRKASARLPRLAMLYKCPGLDHPDAAALSVLEAVLLHGDTGRFDRALRRQQQLATFVSGGYWGLRDPGPFVIEAEARPGVALERLEAAIDRAIAEVVERGITPEELEVARRRIQLGTLAGLESTAARARAIGCFQTISRRGWRYLPEHLARLATLDRDEVHAAAARYLVRSRRTVVHQQIGAAAALRPVQGAAAFPAAAGPGVPPPPAARSPRAAVPAPFGASAWRMVLPNGLVVLYERVAQVPTVSLAIALGGAAALDPPGREGLAALVLELLRTGTERFHEDELLRRFAALGSTLRTERYPDWVQLSMLAHSRDLGSALELLAEVVQRHRPRPDKLARVREELLAAREAAHARPAQRLVEAFYRLLYGTHPYGMPLAGSRAGLAAIGMDEAWRFYTAGYVPQAAVLAIAGAFEPARLADAVLEHFGGWRAELPAGTPVGVEAVPAVDCRPCPGVAIIDKPDQTQAHVRVGLLAVARNHPDWDALVLGNHALGGGGVAARLSERVRTQEGLAYSARSQLIARCRTAPFVAAVQTRNDAVARVLRLVQEEVARARSQPFTEAELARARSQLATGLRFRRETHAGRVATLLEAELFRLGPDHLEREVAHMRELAPEQVRAALARHLDPDRFTTVVVAPAAAVADALAPFGPPLSYREEP